MRSHESHTPFVWVSLCSEMCSSHGESMCAKLIWTQLFALNLWHQLTIEVARVCSLFSFSPPSFQFLLSSFPFSPSLPSFPPSYPSLPSMWIIDLFVLFYYFLDGFPGLKSPLYNSKSKDLYFEQVCFHNNIYRLQTCTDFEFFIIPHKPHCSPLFQ